MHGTVWEEREASAPASEAWKLYEGLQLGKLQILPALITEVNVIQGDGSAGTTLKAFFAPVISNPYLYQFATFRLLDLKACFRNSGRWVSGYGIHSVSGPVRDAGEGGNGESVHTKATIEYELKEEAATNAALVSIMQFAADYLHQNNSIDNN